MEARKVLITVFVLLMFQSKYIHLNLTINMSYFKILYFFTFSVKPNLLFTRHHNEKKAFTGLCAIPAKILS